MAPEDLLLAARDVMRDCGWARGLFEDEDGRVCLKGSVMRTLEGNPDEVDLYKSATSALEHECHERFGKSVVYANDECIANADEACDVLEAAAKRAASEAGGAS